VIRNAVLAVAALIVLVSGSGPSIDGELGRLNGMQLALVGTSITAAVLAVAVAQLWAERRKLRRELAAAIAAKAPPGLPRGTPAPDFTLTPIRGTASSLSELITGDRPTVLVFVSTSCGPCTALFPSLGRWQDSLSERLNLAVIFSGERDLMERVCEQHGLSTALTQEGEEVFELYALRATPSAVQIGPDGTIGGPSFAGSGAIEALIRSLVARAESDLLPVG
jgi:thiol-disulfide isomerase/thioredoxin